MNYNSRMIETMKILDMTAAEFAQKIGASRQAVSNWKTGSYDTPPKYVIRVIEIFEQIDARWLLTGVETVKSEIDENYEKMETELEDYRSRWEISTERAGLLTDKYMKQVERSDELLIKLLEAQEEIEELNK